MGELDMSGRMGNREVAPATPTVYYDNILAHWAAQNTRYRCLMLDAAAVFFGKFVELVHDDAVNADFVLIGEAIPTDQGARNGAPWFAMPGYAEGPWWKLNPTTGLPSILSGYNFNWTNDWANQTTYFGVQFGEIQNLTGANSDPNDNKGNDGKDLPIGIIYNWTLKGAIPVAWYVDTFQKVGAAWNYATGRVAPSRHVRCPRLLRSARV